jgi:Ca-activated chloride channel family protein
LSGLSGNSSYREVIEVRKAKPSKGNLALRYLWARHRITLLSDYNNLRPNDRRTKEVTELGLNYNLLTATTSFVAVDSEVRNQTGQQTTIKQPLPLPQGVSDYAVGSAKMSLAPASPAYRQEAIASSEDRAVQKEAKPREKEKGALSLGEVTVQGGLSKEAALRVIEKNLSELQQCSNRNQAGEIIILQFVVGRDGKVQSVKVIGKGQNNGNSEQCLMDKIKGLRFSAIPDGKKVTVTLSLVFGPKGTAKG